jgi:hypothetical protein
VRDAQQGTKQQRIQELFGELAMTDPEITLMVAAERQQIDEDRTRAVELDVIGARIREVHTVLQRIELQIEVQQRGGLERAECPLVRVRDMLDRRMFDQVLDAGIREDRTLDRRPFRGRELAAVHQPVTIPPPLEKAGIPDVFVMNGCRAADSTEDTAVEMINVAGRVTERGRVPDDQDANRLVVSFMRRLIVMRAAARA